MPMRDEDIRFALTDLATIVRDTVQPLVGYQRLEGKTEGGDVMSLADIKAAHAVRQWGETQKHFRCSLLLE